MLSTIISAISSIQPSANYHQDFQTAIKDSGLESNVSVLKKISEKLCINKQSFKMDSYLEGVSEVMQYIHFAKLGIPFIPDVKLRLGEATDKDKDVDLQIKINSFAFNIEVKTPEQEIYSENTLKGRYAYRTSQTKEEVNEVMNEVKSILTQGINTQGLNLSVLQQKTQDNKMKDYLSSAQSKFPLESDVRELNILLVCIPIQNISEYWMYLFNSQSGLLTPNSYYRDQEIFDRVDLVILSSIPSLHIAPQINLNSWDMKNVANIICLNSIGK
jgi:hypothetical protein